MSTTDQFLQYQVLQLCDNVIQTCPFTNAVAGVDCTKKFCNGFPAYIGVATCPSLNLDPDGCCASSDPPSCLQNYAHGSGGAAAAPTPNVCASVISILDSCFSATPALSPPPSSLISTAGPSATELASCVCYSTDGTYNPDVLDGFASDCAASGSAAHPTYYPLVTPLQGFCSKNAGSPQSAAASTTLPNSVASTTPDSGSSNQGAVTSTKSPAVSTSSLGPAVTSSSGGASSGVTGAAQTTSTKPSGGSKITIQSGLIFLLGIGMLLSF